jgi:hypothetical protein
MGRGLGGTLKGGNLVVILLIHEDIVGYVHVRGPFVCHGLVRLVVLLRKSEN